MRPEEIRDMADADINQAIEELKDELFDLRMRGAYEELENPARVRLLRRDIARLKTIKGERERAREAKES
ncbi:MAG: 50S ribosomal protein L29 [Gemmatimonadetes bacterium]|uniref:Large ribosomal subunit protein uL29 n=1 Tax=Candidatus Kutchimonas denitrificans TaxID=3056748 RepID=A0AAE4ZAJ5_9BACT|nr:50S ribosomal protein L29 [Gemmatimonadota bacterium]NIR73855.1 50S ribosomal protein L29 [Candidatus Kutchimonas denitrificans]NIR99661.1 50S ribosomal protein L29 [Gemmatimonadota bacterium]NIT65246.1 50S ribosomal protein L29 [Gemmatimonadota bacterium]NIW73695.1 50S ribosomal protein L29 [Gemmatimonadota bacterium]